VIVTLLYGCFAYRHINGEAGTFRHVPHMKCPNGEAHVISILPPPPSLGEVWQMAEMSRISPWHIRIKMALSTITHATPNLTVYKEIWSMLTLNLKVDQPPVNSIPFLEI
jgi:hypothetical protein